MSIPPEKKRGARWTVYGWASVLVVVVVAFAVTVLHVFITTASEEGSPELSALAISNLMPYVVLFIGFIQLLGIFLGLIHSRKAGIPPERDILAGVGVIGGALMLFFVVHLIDAAEMGIVLLRERIPPRLRYIAEEIESFHGVHGRYPTSLIELDGPRTIPLDDPFQHGRSLGYRFWMTGFVLYSAGPDGIVNITDRAIPSMLAKDELANLTYDPTNGTISSGDIFLLWERGQDH